MNFVCCSSSSSYPYSHTHSLPEKRKCTLLQNSTVYKVYTTWMLQSKAYTCWKVQRQMYTMTEQISVQSTHLVNTAECTLLNDKVWSINTNACTLSGDEGTRNHKWQWRLHMQTSSIHSTLFSLLLTKRSFNLFTNCSPYKMPRTWPIWIKYTSKVLGPKKPKKQNGFPLSVTCTSLKLFQNPKRIQRLPVPVLVTSVYCIGGTSLKTLLALCSRRRQYDVTQNLAGFWLEPR